MIVAALVILGPLAAVAAILVVRRGAAALALLGAAVAVAGALATLARVATGDRYGATLPGLPGLSLRLVVDPLAAVLATVVAAVSLLVLVYAVGYMRGEPGQVRFYAGMSFFAAAMQGFVLAGDWILMLAAWELIALASYLLIGFWFERPGVGAAATRAFLTTRAADLGLYLGIFTLIARTGTSEIAATMTVVGPVATVAALALLAAAVGKSAQAPLQGWLPDAMAGPTPVSALLHSATLVVAGVILMIRVFPLLGPEGQLVVGIVGGTTALVTGVMALAERDLKRLLAVSTSSQLGLMFLALGAGSPGAAIVHLMTNAAMKSALFLGAGVFQRARGGTTFAALAGAGRERRPAFAAFVIAGLALAGVPPLAGFWSKDAIVAAAFASPNAWLLAPLAFAGTLLTGLYVARALRLLWREAPAATPIAGKSDEGGGAGAMGVSLAGSTALAAALGLAMGPLARLLRVEIAGEFFSAGALVSLIAAGVGLIAGWTLPAERLLRPLHGLAGTGFQIGGGWLDLVGRPVLALVRAADRGDRMLHEGVLAVGHDVLRLAVIAHAVDAHVHAGITGFGRLNLTIARASRLTDERGIDGVIVALVRGTRELGARVRRLQTGLVHRELALAAGGAVLLLGLLLIGGLGRR